MSASWFISVNFSNSSKHLHQALAFSLLNMNACGPDWAGDLSTRVITARVYRKVNKELLLKLNGSQPNKRTMLSVICISSEFFCSMQSGTKATVYLL